MKCTHMYIVSSLTDSPVGHAGITGVSILFFTHHVFSPLQVHVLHDIHSRPLTDKLTNVLLLSSLIRI